MSDEDAREIDGTDDGSDPPVPHDQNGVSGPRDHAVTDVADVDSDDRDDRDDRDDSLFPAPVTAAPRTGDPVIDGALAGLEESARTGDLDAQVASGERVHRELQGRLDDLGGA